MATHKRIVYLFGAGATQAESDHQGSKINLLMWNCKIRGEGVAQRILQHAQIYKKLKTDFTEEVDVEKLISLLLVSGNSKYKGMGENLRKSYYEVLLADLSEAGVLANPELAMGLLELHKCPIFNERIEKLSGFIILNHDNLLQTASQKIHECVNLGFKFHSKVVRCADEEEVKSCPLIIKLYGSFDWRNKIPIEVQELSPTSGYSLDMLWIPPSILKETRDYPYNKLAGLAYELLSKRCDILRIVGCSLSQNDWNVISLLFSSQYNQLLHGKTCYKIELIMEESTGERIAKDCSYLQNLFPIGHLTDGYFGYYKGDEKDQVPEISDMSNPFRYWLKTKAKHHITNKEIDISAAGILNKILGEKI